MISRACVNPVIAITSDLWYLSCSRATTSQENMYNCDDVPFEAVASRKHKVANAID